MTPPCTALWAHSLQSIMHVSVWRILLQKNLLQPVGRQEDGMCQHEVIQQGFWMETQTERLVNVSRDLQTSCSKQTKAVAHDAQMKTQRDAVTTHSKQKYWAAHVIQTFLCSEPILLWQHRFSCLGDVSADLNNNTKIFTWNVPLFIYSLKV